MVRFSIIAIGLVCTIGQRRKDRIFGYSRMTDECIKRTDDLEIPCLISVYGLPKKLGQEVLRPGRTFRLHFDTCILLPLKLCIKIFCGTQYMCICVRVRKIRRFYAFRTKSKNILTSTLIAPKSL